MSRFNRFCAKARRAAERVADKAEELVDSAARSVKVRSLEMRIDEKYEDLGRVVYRDLHTDEVLEEEKLELIAAIDALYDELALLKGESTVDEAQDAEQESAEESTATEEDSEQETPSDAE